MTSDTGDRALTDKKCVPCTGDTPRIRGEELQSYMDEIGEEWELIEEHHLERTYTFNDFKEALDFTWDIGQLAEEENHHPQIQLTWGKVEVEIYTHAIDGLSENDFIWSAKADKRYQKYNT